MNEAGDVSSSLGTAMFLVAAMGCAGLIHVLLMSLAPPGWLDRPIDGGMSWRGRRLFGANKRVRGLASLPVAAAVVFAAFGALQGALPEWLLAAMWPLTTIQYAMLGALAGLACMLAELPNSFVKRQLGIEPGEMPRRGLARSIVRAVDRVDSPLGMVIAVSSAVAVQPMTWLWVLLLGSGVHAGLSALLRLLVPKFRNA